MLTPARRLRLRREALAGLLPADLGRVVAGNAPPTWNDCLSLRGGCEPVIDFETSFCPTER